MRPTHLIPGLSALAILLVAAIAMALHASTQEATYVRALAPQLFAQKTQGRALQAAALVQPDLLPVHGSSELYYPGPFHGSELFGTYPTGFAIFPVGDAGRTALIALQNMASLGSDLRGRKIVISVSPPDYTNRAVDREAYAGNFSRLHANELAFNLDLSLELKQAIASRMLRFPDTLRTDPLLRFALERLEDGSPVARAAYYAVLPVGKLQCLLLSLQDHWATLAIIGEQRRAESPLDPVVRRQPAILDWPALLAKAEREQLSRSDNNPFGFDNEVWLSKWRNDAATRSRSWSDDAFLRDLSQSTEWTDLDLLLQVLRELEADPLIVAMPLKGVYYDYLGVSADARETYYARLHLAVNRYGYPLVDFEDYDDDALFTVDPYAHPSWKGWAHYAQVLDAFFHGALG